MEDRSRKTGAISVEHRELGLVYDPWLGEVRSAETNELTLRVISGGEHKLDNWNNSLSLIVHVLNNKLTFKT